jgi:hypothetical protein
MNAIWQWFQSDAGLSISFMVIIGLTFVSKIVFGKPKTRGRGRRSVGAGPSGGPGDGCGGGDGGGGP